MKAARFFIQCPCGVRLHHWLWILCSLCGTGFFTHRSQAQLLITEVMSLGSLRTIEDVIIRGPDYWELTNYGDKTASLKGYRFDDNSFDLEEADDRVFGELIIAPGESIVFAKNRREDFGGVLTPERFRQIWGIPDTIQVAIYKDENGLSSAGDWVVLWSPTAVDDQEYVDLVIFGDAIAGVSLTRDPFTGLFGTPSRLGDGMAFEAALTDDVGSPGVPPAKIPMFIQKQPADVRVNIGDDIRLSIEFYGLPPPHCQWFREGSEEAIASGPELKIDDSTAASTGVYFAELDDGRTQLRSRGAAVTVNTGPAGPQFRMALPSLEGYIAQSLTMEAKASAVPPPTYAWWFNDRLLEEQTSSSLTLDSLDPTQSGIYSVVASNPYGKATNSTTLRVLPFPDLRITEVMSSPSPNTPTSRHMDWWELTNFDQFGVDLHGFRFTSNNKGVWFKYAWTNNTQIVLQPGESMIFVENLAATEFLDWWGRSNLPPNLKVVGYHGPGLSLNASQGDLLRLWNAAAANESDFIASVDFNQSPTGVTFNFLPEMGEFNGTSKSFSVEGVRGAFKAASGSDVGSPGYVPQRRIVARRVAQGCELSWDAEPEIHYELLAAPQPEGPWHSLVSETSPTAIRMKFVDPLIPEWASRFYRLAETP